MLRRLVLCLAFIGAAGVARAQPVYTPPTLAVGTTTATCATTRGHLNVTSGVIQCGQDVTTSGSPAFPAITVNAGAGAGTVRPGGLLCMAAADSATTGTSEQVLATCTLPANTLAETGVTVFVDFAVVTTGGGAKACNVELGGISGQTVFAFFNGTGATTRVGRLTIMRSGASTQRTSAMAALASGAVGAAVTDTTATETNALDLVMTCTSGTIGEITFKSWSVFVNRVPS